MGLPSLLEDIVQKRIDDFLQAELSSAQIYTRDDFKRILSHMGINARNLLSVSDDELVEISEAFAKDAQELRLEVLRLEEENCGLASSRDRAEAEAADFSSKASEARKKIKQLEIELAKRSSELAKRSSELLKGNQDIAALRLEVSQLTSMIEGLRHLGKLVDRK